MRFTTALVAGALAVAASAQNGGSPTSSLSPAQSSVAACLEECSEDDIGCRARCAPVPNPSRQQVEDTHNCIADCDQTNAREYATCLDACIYADYYRTDSGTPEPTGGAGSGSGNGNGSNQDANTTEGGDAASGTGSTGVAPTGSASETDSNGSATSSGDSPDATESNEDGDSSDSSEGEDDDDNAANGVFVSLTAIFGAVAALVAL